MCIEGLSRIYGGLRPRHLMRLAGTPLSAQQSGRGAVDRPHRHCKWQNMGLPRFVNVAL